MSSAGRTGVLGEKAAVRWLRRRGWRIIETNRRVGHDEIDVIAESPDGETVAFVEVKSSRMCSPQLHERVVGGKRDRLRRSARRLAGCFPDHLIRVDVMTVERGRWRWPRIRHFVNVIRDR